MRQSFLTLAASATLVGCASTPSTDLPPVPVYTADEVPCPYEVIEEVRATTGASMPSLEAYERVRDRELGAEGAELGADAVVVPDATVGVARRREIGGRRSSEPSGLVTFRGEAIRFTSVPCGDR